MTGKTQVTQHLNNYLAMFPGEAKRCKLFTDFMDRNNADSELYSRKNFDGHITTSAFIINAPGTEILLLHHKSLNRWLQPGGHTENDESLLHSALREAAEETGIPASQLKHIALSADEEMPFDIDSHYIPENQRRHEAGHYHHDFRYLFVYDGGGMTRFNPDESNELKWVPFSDLIFDDTFGEMIKKIKATIYPPNA